MGREHLLRVGRRGLITGSAASLVLAAAPSFGQGGAPVAATKAGKVRGRIVDGISVFQGVPYGASTAGRTWK